MADASTLLSPRRARLRRPRRRGPDLAVWTTPPYAVWDAIGHVSTHHVALPSVDPAAGPAT